MSTDAATSPDLTVSEIKAGEYIVYIKGLDSSNAVWLRTNYEICDPTADCGPREWDEGFCPRTIGYWKNNVRKVYIEGRTNGVQESIETLDAAFKFVALKSKLFRSGINVAAPVAIENPTPLTRNEANAILQKAAGNTMLDRALQQNLASWLNLASGKIGPTAWVVIEVPSGTYEGTMLGALLEAQELILSGTNLERAKDIADMINNGQLTINTDPESNETGTATVYNDPTNVTCTIYAVVLPGDKQPPKHKDMPKADKPNEPPQVTVEPPPDPNTCEGAIVNNYSVEVTENPFHSIKFNFVPGGTEVKNGGYDIFQFTLPAADVASMTTMQLEAKAGTEQVIVTATYEACAFDSTVACEPIRDATNSFSFQFLGATDNGDGTLTLAFAVTNFTSYGLSHASFGLPSGVAPSAPTGNYEAKVCPAP
jgi:hypothetical protein